MQIAEINYLAGLIDGEGCFGLTLAKSQRHTLHIRPCISMSTTSVELFEFAGKTWPFMTRLGPFERKGVNAADTYRLIIDDRANIKAVSETLLPHLVIKGKQAALMLDFLSYRGDAKTAVARFLWPMNELNNRGNAAGKAARTKLKRASDLTKIAKAATLRAARTQRLDARTCLHCGGSMAGRGAGAKYCSPSHTVLAYYKRHGLDTWAARKAGRAKKKGEAV